MTQHFVLGTEKGEMYMLDKDKKILENLTKAIPNMSEFNKGYLFGMGEALAEQKKTTERKKNQWQNLKSQ